MPDITQAALGRRIYHIQRAKTVEEAMKMMQQGVGAEWKSLSEADIVLVSHLLQCTWNIIDRGIWDRITFVKATGRDVREILSHGEGVKPGHNPAPEQVDEIKRILLSIG
jgi:hypothetical protein